MVEAAEPLFRPSQGDQLSSVALQPTVQAETVPRGRRAAGGGGHEPVSADFAGGLGPTYRPPASLYLSGDLRLWKYK